MLLEGKNHKDHRGIITYNNYFNASLITQIYTIENHSPDFIRGWQGHQIEQRWFAAMSGSFEIRVIKVDDFDNPSKDLSQNKYKLTADNLDFLHVPAGYITAIQALEEHSKLLVLADYGVGEVQDEYRYPLEYFNGKE